MLTTVLSAASVEGEPVDIDALRARNAHLALLARVSEQLVVGPDAAAALDAVLESLCEALGFELAFHFRVPDEAPRTLRLASSRGLTAQQRAHYDRIAFGQYLCGMVAETGEPLLAEQLPLSPYREAAELCAAGVRCYAGWPLKVRGELLGTLSLATRTRDRLAEGEVQLIQTVCDLLAVQLARAHGEQAMRRQAEMLRLSFDAIIVRRMDGAIESWNRGAEELYGYAEAEALGRRADELLRTVHPVAWSDIAAHLRERGHWEGELRHRARDGRELVVSSRQQLLRDPDGVARVLEIDRDVTARESAEAALRASERKFRATLQDAPVAVVHAAPDGQLAFVNRAFCDLVGYTAEELFGKTWQEITHPDDLDTDLALAQRVLAGELPHYTMEKRYLRKDGTPVWVLLFGNFIRDDAGRVTHGVGVAIDITERKRSEAALRESERRLSIAKTAARLGIHDYDVRTGRIDWDARVRELWGVTSGEPVTDETFFAGLHPDDRAPTRAAVDAALDPDGDGRFFATYRVVSRIDRCQRWIEATGQVTFENGAAVRLIGTVADITERKRAGAVLRAAHDTFRHLVERSPFGVYAVDADFRLVHVSAGAQKVFENVQPLLGRDFAEVLRILWPEPFATEAIARFRRTLETGEAYHAPSTAEPRNDIDAVESYDWKLERVMLPDGRYGVVCHFYDLSERQRYEDALRVSEARLRLFIEHAPAAIAMFDQEMRYLAVSERWRSDYRVAGELVGRSHYEVFPEIPERWREVHRCVLAGEARRSDGEWLERLDGQRQWIRWDALPWHTATGEVGGIIISTEDITQRKRTEEALRRSEERLRISLRAANAGSWDWNVRTGEIAWSTENHALHDLDPSPGSPRYADWESAVHPEDLPRTNEAIAQVVAGRLPEFRSEYRVRRHDGEIRWLLGVGRVEYASDGAPLRMSGINIDITERKEAERALRESEERFRTLAEHMSQFCWMADAQGWIYWYNRRWYDYTGTTLDEMQGWGWKKVHHTEHVDRVVERIQRAWDTGEPWEDIFPLRGRNGEYRWFLSRAVPIRDDRGAIVRWFGTNTDITEQRAAEEALREADRRKDEFLATLAHELRNPLAPIRQAAAIAGSPAATAAQIRWSYQVIDRQVRHMALLLDDLLDVSRITRGNLALDRTRLTVREVVDAAIETARPHVESRRHALEVALPTEPLVLEGDALRLAQVLSNLLTNAAKYTELDGRIRVSARRTGDVVEITVADNGVGIPPDQLERVFEMFAQGPAPSHLAQGGLGIGLALARGLVALHGGSLDARSEGVGRGAEFVVRLPLVESADALADPSTSAGFPATPRRRILVVDDNVDAAESLATLLRLQGHEVETAHDGEAGLHAARRFGPEVVLLDLGLPRMDGLEVARRLRALEGAARSVIVALTGWGQVEDQRRTEAAGFDHHLTKPLDPQTLAGILARAPGREH